MSPGIIISDFLKLLLWRSQRPFFGSPRQAYIRSSPWPCLFFSSLKNANISDEKYAFCQKVWHDHKNFSHPSITPYEYFSEMSPMFCTTDIPFEVIGPNMQNHATRFNPSTKPRRLLVGGMRALHLLIAIPLHRLYVKHGSEVTKIYQTMEYNPHKWFRNF